MNPLSTQHETIVYRSLDDRELRMEMYRPGGAGNGAAVVCIHGGGWSQGSRQRMVPYARRLAEQGYVGCALEYRLSSEAPWPAQLRDVQAALRWLEDNASALSIDTRRIGAFGSSAGGHLAAFLGLRPGDSGRPGRVACVVDVHGVHETLDRPDVAWQRALLGDPVANRPLWEDASPLRFVDEHAAPMFLVHDPADTIVPYSHSVKMLTRLAAAGREVHLLPTPGSGHGFIHDPNHPWTQKFWPIALQWMDRHLTQRRVEQM